MKTLTDAGLACRWGRRSDMGDVLRAELCLRPDERWDEEEYLQRLRKVRCVLRVATAGGVVAGHMVYWLRSDHFQLERLVVPPPFRGRGVGRKLVSHLRARLEAGRRAALHCTVPEDAIDLIHFLSHCGLRAERVVRGEYGDRDGYDFVTRSVCCANALRGKGEL